MLAVELAQRALGILAGDRERTHGPKRKNHENIAALWNAWFSIRRDPKAPLSSADVAKMMALLKIARAELGTVNPDDFIDGGNYLFIAGELETE